MVECLAARGRRLERDAQLLAQRGLADELLQPPRAQRAVELVVGEHRDGVWIRSSLTGGPRAARWTAAPRGSRRWRRAAARRPPSARSRARAAGAGQLVRAVGAGDGDGGAVLGGRHADLLAQLGDDPLGDALADPRRALQPLGVARGDAGDHVARGAAGQDAERDLGADALDAGEQLEELALLLGGEAVERHRVLTDDEVGEQRHRPADGGDLAQRLGRHAHAVADAARGLDHDVVRPAQRHLARDRGDHPAAPIAAASGARLTWQIATASASAA